LIGSFHIGMIHFQFLGLAHPVQRGKDPTDAHRNTPTIKESLHTPENDEINDLALLLGHTDGASTAASGLGVLATDTQAPVVTETAVGADLLEALEILTELGVQGVGDNLVVLAVDDVALSVQEPGGDLVLGGGLENGDDALKLFGGEFTSTVNKFVSISAQFSSLFWRELCNVSYVRSLPPLATSTVQKFCASVIRIACDQTAQQILSA
jgi:hypothetical protein